GGGRCRLPRDPALCGGGAGDQRSRGFAPASVSRRLGGGKLARERHSPRSGTCRPGGGGSASGGASLPVSRAAGGADCRGRAAGAQGGGGLRTSCQAPQKGGAC